MPSMTWRLSDWLGLHKKGIRHRRKRLSRCVAAENLEPRALLAGTASVSGLTFIDANGSGNTGQAGVPGDDNEIVVRGIVVTLSNADNSFNKTVTTDANGSFTFFRVPAGTYTLTGQPGAQLTGSAATKSVMVGESGEVNANLALGGLKPAFVSLREFRNTSTNEALPFAAAGTGRNGNELPTVLSTANLDITTTTSASPTATNVDLSGVFTDPNFQNSEIKFHTTDGDINVELYDKDAPQTVANFYEYINNGSYNNSIFHRRNNQVGVNILQGGGFEYTPGTGATDPTITAISVDPSVKNEFSTSRSNVAGTIAMAKTSNPDSATSQFFFNLADDSSQLDLTSNSGGFTVFGRVVGQTSNNSLDIGTSMSSKTLSDLAATATQDKSGATAIDPSVRGALGQLPLRDAPGTDTATNFPVNTTNENFLRVIGVDTVQRNEALTYTLMSGGSAVSAIDTSLFHAEIVNHRLKVMPKAGQSGQADIVVQATDLSGESVTTTFKVHVVPVGNVAPTATVALNPAQPLVNSTLTATATATDGDSNPVNLTYVWKQGSTIVKTTPATSSLTDTLDLSTLSTNTAGDVITVEVTPNDGFVDGTKVTATKTLATSNTAPTATVALSPDSPLVNSTLTATATTTDVNGQPVTLTYVWKVGSTTVKTTSSTSNLTDTLDLSTVATEVAGDVITVEVTPNDGTVNGTKVTATKTLAASNSAPTATVALTPAIPLVDSVLTATSTAADVNGQPVKLTYVWKVGSTTVKTTSATSNLTDTLNLSTIDTEVAGDTITVEVTPNDGTVDGTKVTATRTLNSAPTATVAVTPASPEANSLLTATAVKSDINNDPVTLTYVWKVGTTVVKTTSGSNSLTNTLNLGTEATVHPGDTVSVEVTPNDGTNDGAVATAARVVVNSTPSATVAITPSSPEAESLLTATATKSDVNGDPVTLTYVWKVGTNVVKTTSGSSSLTNTLNLGTEATVNVGDTVSVEVTPNDGTADGVVATNTQVVVNSAPTATVAITPSSPTAADLLTATATKSDINGDSIALIYVWKVGTTVVKTTPASSSLTDTLDLATEASVSVGDSVSVEVTPNDGSINGITMTDTKTIS